MSQVELQFTIRGHKGIINPKPKTLNPSYFRLPYCPHWQLVGRETLEPTSATAAAGLHVE